MKYYEIFKPRLAKISQVSPVPCPTSWRALGIVPFPWHPMPSRLQCFGHPPGGTS